MSLGPYGTKWAHIRLQEAIGLRMISKAFPGRREGPKNNIVNKMCFSSGKSATQLHPIPICDFAGDEVIAIEDCKTDSKSSMDVCRG